MQAAGVSVEGKHAPTKAVKLALTLIISAAQADTSASDRASGTGSVSLVLQVHSVAVALVALAAQLRHM